MGRPVDGFPAFAPEAATGRALRITVVGEEILHRPCRAAADFGTAELTQLISDMFATMYVAKGAGLAANQVGVDLRLFVYDCLDDEGERHVGHILNPVLDPIDAKLRSPVEAGEGCLSVPGPRHALARNDKTIARGVDSSGEAVVIEGTGFFARCLAHEADHLDGVLYVDRLTEAQRLSVHHEMIEMRESVWAGRRERAIALGIPDLSGVDGG
ncbi:peptide deformylase 3 [Rhizocola hellebori]|uniref:Peptide deformylase n=2 Tax=Rhizocola hellebori TaxID=1392758 RepID=A0A8J3Q3S6_9ACTN|nr:peptide deformylase 3 [Rhizocola hellebori]